MNHTKYIITPQIEKEIIDIYRNKVDMKSCRLGYHPVRDLSNKYNIPRSKITKTAQRLGLIPKIKKEPPWSKEELAILEKHAHKVPERIQIYLKKAGYKRSVTGIVLKRKRLHLLKSMDEQSALQLAKCFGVDATTVCRWIALNYLKAIKRGTARTIQQGGDMWWIKAKDIREFVLNYLDEIDLRKVDKYWFVDLLTNKAG